MRVLAAMLLAAIAGTVGAQNAERGKALYETHCFECHYERIHKRDPARSQVRSYPALQAEVGRWAELAKQRLSISDLDDIAEYLNRSHYRLPR